MPKINVKVPHMSDFSKSHKVFLTTKCGTLTPILCDELIPSTKVYLRDAIQACLPPLATDTFMRVNLKVEAFFVPSRLLYGGFESWLTKEPLRIPTRNNSVYAKIPVLRKQVATGYPLFDSGTLGDYLGVRCKAPVTAQTTDAYLNIFPFLAYHKIYDDWYRNTNVQSPVFVKPLKSAQAATLNPVYNLPFVTLDNYTDDNNPTFAVTDLLADGVALGSLRQRNFGYDYFTSAFNSPQRGDAQKVTIDSGDNTFTISALRAANSMQQFAERNQLAGYRMQDYVKANYGADLSNGVAQRSIYLGSGELNVYNKGVYQTATIIEETASRTNPFGDSGVMGIGAKFGDASANGEISLVQDFVAQEPGYLMVLASLVPVVTYASGIDKMMLRYNAQNSQVDMATPLLQNVGNEPIYASELTGIPDDTAIFGYTDRYASYKQKFDSLHGLVRDGQSLQAFALQRTISGSPEISSEFLEIPTDYMDQITNVPQTISNYGCWIDVFHDYKVAMPLSEYSIPSLQDPAYEHGKDVQIELNGSKMD